MGRPKFTNLSLLIAIAHLRNLDVLKILKIGKVSVAALRLDLDLFLQYRYSIGSNTQPSCRHSSKYASIFLWISKYLINFSNIIPFVYIQGVNMDFLVTFVPYRMEN